MIRVQPPEELDAFYREPDPWGYHGHPDDARRRSELLGVLPRRPFRRVLDVGCGNGFVTLSLPGDEVVGIDVSAEAVRWAREAAQRERDPARFRFECLSLFDPAIESLGRFDLVVITGVLYPQYVGHAYSVARWRLDQALEPGGILASCHIREWTSCRPPYSLLDMTLYPYRGRTHQLEIYRK